jgi:hypothetical protein
MEKEMKQKTKAASDGNSSGSERRRENSTETNEHESAQNDKSSGAGNSKGNHETDLSPLNAPELLVPLSDLHSKVYEEIANEPVSLESLLKTLNLTPSELSSALTILELEGLVESLPGSRYVRSQSTQNEQADSGNGAIEETTAQILQSAIGFIQCLFHGVSRKYVQLYLAYFGLIRNRGVAEQHRDPFFKACYESGETGLAGIRAYISPLKVQVSTADIAPAHY